MNLAGKHLDYMFIIVSSHRAFVLMMNWSKTSLSYIKLLNVIFTY